MRDLEDPRGDGKLSEGEHSRAVGDMWRGT